MPKYNNLFNTTNNETYDIALTHVENNGWDFENSPLHFKGRPASAMEKKTYNIQRGVINDETSMYLYCSNLPDEAKPNDKVWFLGKVWTVTSVGYYFDSSRFIDASVFDPEYIKARCPKGLTLK